MPPVETYLKYRDIFITLNFVNEIHRVDIYYELNFLYDKNGNLIKIL